MKENLYISCPADEKVMFLTEDCLMTTKQESSESLDYQGTSYSCKEA